MTEEAAKKEATKVTMTLRDVLGYDKPLWKINREIVTMTLRDVLGYDLSFGAQRTSLLGHNDTPGRPGVIPYHLMQ